MPLEDLKVDFSDSWVHLRPSNTEPVLRIYAEAPSAEEAQAFVERFRKELTSMQTA